MKWYFASRTRHQENLRSVVTFLEDRGESVLSSWVKNELLPFDYQENLEATQAFSQEVVKALLETDIFILISDPEGTDMFVELGVCLAAHDLSGKNRIYIVGKHSKRSLMQLHPSIVHVTGLQEVLEEEGIDVSNFNVPEFD